MLTILCDLERGKVIDLLPHRSVASREQWMRDHPGRKLSVLIEPVCMPQQRRRPCRRLFRLPTVGIFFTSQFE